MDANKTATPILPMVSRDVEEFGRALQYEFRPHPGPSHVPFRGSTFTGSRGLSDSLVLYSRDERKSHPYKFEINPESYRHLPGAFHLEGDRRLKVATLHRRMG